MTDRRPRLDCEEGQALVSGLILLAGVLIPLLFLVPLFARLEQGRLVTEQAARDAVRAAVQATSATSAQAAADEALTRAQGDTSAPLQLALKGQFARGALLQATVTAHVSLTALPLVGRIGTVTVHSEASAPIDRYRSLIAQNP